MQQHVVNEISRFRKAITPFANLWSSILVRSAWSDMAGQKRILALSITLEQKSVAQLPRPDSMPEIGNYHVSWQAFEILELDSLLNNLSDGYIDVEGNRILVEYNDNSKWCYWHSLSFGFDRAGVYPYGNIDRPVISLFGSESMHSSVYDGVREHNLANHLKTLKLPYENIADVLQNCLGISYNQQDHLIVSIKARIPVSLEVSKPKQRNRHEIRLSLPKSAVPSKVSIGVIETCHGGRLNRRSLPIKPSDWRKGSESIVAKLDIGFDKTAVKVLLLLSYDGIFLGQNSLMLSASQSNPVIKMHSCLDPDNATFLRALSGQGKNPAHDFEQAIAWLFGFCGFQTYLYGLSPQLGETATDVVAYSPDEKVVLAIECGISHSKNPGKLPKLLARCRKLSETLAGSGIKVIPVFATVLDDVLKSQRRETSDERVALLLQKDLGNIFQLAGSEKSAVKVLSYISSLLRNEPMFRK